MNRLDKIISLIKGGTFPPIKALLVATGLGVDRARCWNRGICWTWFSRFCCCFCSSCLCLTNNVIIEDCANIGPTLKPTESILLISELLIYMNYWICCWCLVDRFLVDLQALHINNPTSFITIWSRGTWSTTKKSLKRNWFPSFWPNQIIENNSFLVH